MEVPLHVRALRGKDVTELNGWESCVLSLLASEEVSFLPRNTAIVRILTPHRRF